MSEREQLREMFIQEAHEHIQHLNEYLLKLEEEPENREYLDALFRSAHTLKGMAATMEYDQIRELCKAIEDIFDRLRKGEEKLSPEMASALFKCFDILQEMVDDENKRIDLDAYLKLLSNPSEAYEAGGADSSSQLSTKTPTIRVKMEDLDTLVNLVGELMIAKMRLDQTITGRASDESRQVLMSLGRLISDIQYHTMRLRLVPVEQIFNRFPRMVRDLARSLGKEVRLEMEGLDIELDRTVLDAITDPLLHILRNAVDHGIESPEERRRAGKPSTGTIKLVATRVGDRVAIMVEDDGKGIDLEKIRARAIERGIVSRAEAEAMSEEDLIELLGTPGLSTSENVTDVSGRGVGLDVVRRQVESVGGQLKIETKKGQGTRMTITIPLSLAIIGGLVVNVGEERYILPLSSITTTVQVDSREIKMIHGKPVITLRDQVVPVISVADILGMSNGRNVIMNADGGEKYTVVVIDKGGKPYGLIVDSFDRKQEIVIKHLDGLSMSSSAFSNATILPDGRVALILDPTLLIDMHS